MVITHAYIYPVVGSPIADGYLRFGTTIEEMGTMEQYAPAVGEEVLDAEGKWLLPGFVDIHTHLGLFGDGVADPGEPAEGAGVSDEAAAGSGRSGL
mgnify:CR=1 FL=1